MDSWTVETARGSQTTEVYSDAKFTLLVREVVKEDGSSKVTVVPFTNGEELRRLISALQSAAAAEANRQRRRST
ncbi:MAG TPA: hypothetical protein VLL05_18790 [Terriglobales bacterium]|nr:hypothetical protein [Terriglobales bacterium]